MARPSRANAMPRTPRSLFPPFAGVALADILANSVAIVIIMIVVLLMTRHEQEREKLTQTEDVAVLLSRELASSFVMNALPTSPPAQLHDYVASPLDRSPHHATMPIVELRASVLRDYYTGQTYPRDELLRQDNTFDAYLRSLAPEQLAALRVDVHSTRLFYIFMSIVKAHGHSPRHWHFVGAGNRTGGGYSAAALAARPSHEVDDNPSAGGGGRGGRGAATERASDRAAAWPEDVSLALAAGPSRYPDDAAIGRAGAPSAELLDLPGRLPTEDDGRAGRGAEQAARSAGGQMRFRAAAPITRTAQARDERAFDLAQVLRGLWAFMAEEQTSADNGLPSRLPRYDFERHVLRTLDAALGVGRVAEPPEQSPRAEPFAQVLRGLVFLLRVPRQPAEGALTLRPTAASTVRGQALAVFPNEPIGRVLWRRDAHQTPREELLGAAVTLRLGLHAAVHEGVRVALGRDSVLLTPYAEADPDPTPRWRVVTLVSAARDDFVTGFLYAAVDEDGRLVLPVDENAIAVGGLRLESHRPPVAFRGESRQLWLYGLVAAVFGLGLVARYWRPA